MLNKFKYIKPIFDIRNELETQMLLLLDEQIQLPKSSITKREENFKSLIIVQRKLEQIHVMIKFISQTLINLSNITPGELTIYIIKIIEVEIRSIELSQNKLDPKKIAYQLSLDIHNADLEIMKLIQSQYPITSTCSECSQDFIHANLNNGICNNCLRGNE